MATSISSIGVGSGLPLDTLLEDLRKVENVPLAALQTRAQKEQQRFSAYGTLKSALDAVSTAATALGKAATFNGVKASVTGESFTASVKADAGAVPGNYSVKVEKLARAQSLTSQVSAKRNESLVSGGEKVDIRFTVDGKTHTISLDPAKSSLDDVVKAINSNANLKASATLVKTGDADDSYRLIISADETGEKNSITSIEIERSGGGTDGLDELRKILEFGTTAPTEGEGGEGDEPVSPFGMKESVSAQDAEVIINGDITLRSSSNTIENAISGVTLTLAKESDSADTLKVTRDDSAATTAVNNFVSSYNALLSTIKTLTVYDVDAQSGAPLTGDGLPRRAQAMVREAFSGLSFEGVSLSALGFKTDPTTGNLSVDTTKFTSVLENNRAAVEQLFTGEDGFSKRVTAAVETFTKKDGLIQTSQDNITKALKQLERQYEQMESRIEQKMENYRKQFVQLDAFMAQQNSISSYLTSQLSMLENLASGNSKSK